MLSKEQKNIILETLKPFNPSYIGLFGSFARNEETETSDIDILYEMQKKYSLFDLMDLKETLKNKLHREVDLVSREYLNKRLRHHVEKDLIVLLDGE